MNVAVLFDSAPTEFYVLFQVVVALLLGGLVGWERETAGKWAGLRTHILVCIACTLFVRMSFFLAADAHGLIPGDTLRTDPVRAIEAIATGIAFLGAGTVLRDPDAAKARGLTTAASLLATASIGIAIALDRYIIAAGTTLLAFFVLRVMQRFET